nr:FHIPEP family type III secretion protein [Escherichia coli]
MLSRSDLLTLLTINFIVVTKGAERISEVSARFTLGKVRISRSFLPKLTR